MAWSKIGGSLQTGPTNSITLPAVVANDVLVVGSVGGADKSTIDIIDSLSNSWTKAYLYDATNDQYSAWWIAIANGAGTPAITFSNEGQNFCAQWCQVYRSDAGVPSIDQFGSSLMQAGVTSIGTDTLLSPAAVTTADGDLIIGYVQNDSDASVYAAGTGFVEDRAGDGLGAGNWMSVESMEQASAGSVQATWSPASVTRAITAIAAIKSGGASAPQPTHKGSPRRGLMGVS